MKLRPNRKMAFSLAFFVSIAPLSAMPSGYAHAEAKPAIKSAPVAKNALIGFDAVIAEALKTYNQPGLAIVVVKDDKVILLKGYGVRDFNSKVPVDPDTQYVLASATKQFVAFGVGQLVDKEKLDFDKPVRNYIPDFELKDPMATQLVSLRDMLSHRTGLPRHDMMWYGNDKFTRADMIKRLRYLELSAQPRQVWQYNNLMYMSSGYAIQMVTGQTWEDYTKENIFKPLGMTNTNFSVEDVKKSPDHATPYERKKGVPTAIPFRNVDTLGPAGSINSTARDLVPWLRVNLNDGKLGDTQIISAGSLAQIHAPQGAVGPGNPKDGLSPGGYAMGFFTESYRGHWRVQHGGNLDGFTSRITLFPQEKLGIAVLVNMEVSNLPELITRTLSDRILGLEKRDWLKEGAERLKLAEASTTQAETRKGETQIKDTKPSRALADYVATYTHPAYGDMVISMGPKGLEGQYNSFKFLLNHWHFDTFKGEVDGKDETFKDMSLTFRLDPDGRVASIETSLEGAVKPIEFERKAPKVDVKVLQTYVGTYAFQGRDFVITLQGEDLYMAGPGQNPYKLSPDIESGYFTVSGIRLRFKTEGGKVVALEQIADNGVYSMTRKP
jgi:CubicO group peptidase (beta-lactamase class C family)